MATAGTQAFGINDLGQIVGTYGTFAKDPFSGGSNVVTHSFLYSDGVFNTIDDPLALSSISAHGFGGTFAHAINNHSQIVGTVTEFSGSHGFVLTITPNSPPPVATFMRRRSISGGANHSLSASWYCMASRAAPSASGTAGHCTPETADRGITDLKDP